ncbi:MAG: HlyD family secretion protein [Planctomycetes bacterium]|nr:HlyD family secretion protein [Planctomycetota bacterium]
MIAVMLIIYTSIVLVLFKLKFVKPRPFPIAMVVLVGILTIGGIVVAWTLGAPLSSRVVTSQYVVQLVPYVKGQVLKVHAKPLTPVKKGDLLLEINPAPYQYTVNELTAKLQAAKDNVKQAGAALEVAQANVQKSKSSVTQAKAAVDQATAAVSNAKAGVLKATALDQLAKTEEKIVLSVKKMDPGAVSDIQLTKAVQNREAADATLKQAEAAVGEAVAAENQSLAGLNVARDSQQQAEAAARQATFALQVAESNVPAVQAQLDDALFNLTQCRMYAPADGYVVNWQVQEGTMLVPMPMAAAGTFVNTSQTFIAASFPQNYLVNVRPGDPVELILDPFPGRLFNAEVEEVIPATGEGQFAPSGQIPEASKVGSQGLFAVKIRLKGDSAVPQLPLGAGGTVAIYTTEIKPVHIITKVVIRMKKWLQYVIPS